MRFYMKRSRKLKRVVRTSGSNPCQVKWSFPKHCPLMVGKNSQDHPQSKRVSTGSSITGKYDDLPPRFEDIHFQNPSKAELPHIPHIKWKCPSLLNVSYDWHVAAGEDSTETFGQKLREMRVPEAIYPCISTIPYSPSVSSVVKNECYDDSLTPLIPLSLVEEEEVEESVEVYAEPESCIKKLRSQNLQQQYSPPTTSLINPQCINNDSHYCGKLVGATSLEEDVVAAASTAAIAAIVKRTGQGTFVDLDMLLKLFTDPTMIEKLIEESRTPTTTISSPSNDFSISTSYTVSSAAHKDIDSDITSETKMD